MKILKALIGAVALLAVISLFLPASTTVSRSRVIEAQPPIIFATVNELKSWPTWTVWNNELDPTAQYTWSAKTEGVGAWQAWHGKKMGQGKLTIIEADPTSGIRYRLEFDQGAMVSDGTIRLTPADGGTQVTWTDTFEAGWNPVSRYFGLMMDSMVGRDFEQGLIGLEELVEALPPPAPPAEVAATDGDDAPALHAGMPRAGSQPSDLQPASALNEPGDR